jgi:hypothetical protein
LIDFGSRMLMQYFDSSHPVQRRRHLWYRHL